MVDHIDFAKLIEKSYGHDVDIQTTVSCQNY